MEVSPSPATVTTCTNNPRDDGHRSAGLNPRDEPDGAFELPEKHVAATAPVANHDAQRAVGHERGQPRVHVDHGAAVPGGCDGPEHGGDLLLPDGAEGEDAARGEELGDGDAAHLAPVIAVGREDDVPARPPWVSTRMVELSGRVANEASWVFITSRAASRDETTSVGTSPSQSSMTGHPCRRARSRMARCGSAPTMWCMLPITGSVHGPGGSRSLSLPSAAAPLPRRQASRTTSSDPMASTR
uniref:Uncharacterized protein n=1 Tax=Aegilops tauschii TaxID=37682 RepID=R7W4C9_AEGTA